MHKKVLPLYLILCLATEVLTGQCITNIDFNTWQQAGVPANGNWQVQGGGTQVYQSVNGNPTFFVSPYDLMNVRITGNFMTTNGDDDYMGFVFSFNEPMGASDTFKTWLFDWKRGTQASGGYTGKAGKNIAKLDGVIPTGDYSQTFWGHESNPAFTMIDSDYVSGGWVQGTNHAFELQLSFTQAKVFIDGNLIFDVQDCFAPGRFGFYNYSQPACTYSNFQYSLDIDFAITDTQICQGTLLDLEFIKPCSGVTYNFTQYQYLLWDFGDGTGQTVNNPNPNNVNVNHIYTQPGVYDVTLTLVDAQGCSATKTKQITVTPTVAASFTGSPVCQGNPSVFTDASTGGPTQWNWSFDDGSTATTQNPVHQYALPGTYNVTLIANNSSNCPDTISAVAEVYPAVQAAFTTANVCYEEAVQFTDQSTGPVTQYSWSFGDGQTSALQNPAHYYASAGAYNPQLIVSSAQGCADTAQGNVTVHPKPTASFTVLDDCEGLPSVFTNTSSVSSGSITSNNWNFDNAATSTQQNTSYTYAAAGTHTAELIVVTDNSCSDTLLQQVTVFPHVVADYSAADVCYPNPIVFNNLSTGPVVNYRWIFGDGQTDVQPNVQHFYASHGAYNAAFIVSSNSGCADTVEKVVTVFPKPVSDYTVNAVCDGFATTFTSTATVATGNVVAQVWDLGDGSNNTQPSFNHSYAASGTYNALLVVQTDNNCADTLTKAVTVHPLPQPAFTALPVCMGVPTAIVNTSAIPSGSIALWQWNLGDGNGSTAQQANHQYSTNGTYTVKLVATSDEGCVDSVEQQVVVYELPSGTATSTEACYQADNGTALATGSNGLPPYTYVWSNGTADAQATLLYAGTYIVTITDANGCTTQLSETVTQPAIPLTVNALPALPTIKQGDVIQISLLNSYADNAAQYVLNVTDGVDCYTCSQFNAYPAETTTYTVSVTDSKGCPGAGEFTIYVDPSLPVFLPNAFTPNGDGQNDTWGIFGQGIRYVNLKVFNRIGEKVFETNNATEGWDGTFRGRPAAPGTYVYQGNIVLVTGESKPVKGALTLIK